MPLLRVVDTFVNNRDFSLTTKAQRDLIVGYRRDITKYAQKDKALVRAIFDSIPFQLAKQDKRFILSELKKERHAESMLIRHSGLLTQVWHTML